ncbi:MAG: helix-turn-helix transcriptional regulator [Steroidobacteraceae bacterium]
MERHRISQATLGPARATRGRPAAPLNYLPGAPVAAPMQLLRIADICRLFRISKPTFWRMRKDPAFPSPADISPGVVGWYASDIETWVNSRRRATGRASTLPPLR